MHTRLTVAPGARGSQLNWRSWVPPTWAGECALSTAKRVLTLADSELLSFRTDTGAGASCRRA